MTQDEIIEMAGHRLVSAWVIKLVCDAVDKEREACADNVETYYDPMWTDHYQAGNELAKMIRARKEL